MSDHAVILLVEDQEDDIFLIRKAFRRAGVINPIHVVRDGVQAVEYLSGEGPFANRAEHPLPALILLDLKMPRMDGYQVLQWLRQQEDFGSIPVIVLTTTEHGREINMAYSLGANSFLNKPGDFKDYEALASVIHTYWLKRAKLPETSRTPRKVKDRQTR